MFSFMTGGSFRWIVRVVRQAARVRRMVAGSGKAGNRQHIDRALPVR